MFRLTKWFNPQRVALWVLCHSSSWASRIYEAQKSTYHSFFFVSYSQPRNHLKLTLDFFTFCPNFKKFYYLQKWRLWVHVQQNWVIPWHRLYTGCLQFLCDEVLAHTFSRLFFYLCFHDVPSSIFLVFPHPFIDRQCNYIQVRNANLGIHMKFSQTIFEIDYVWNRDFYWLDFKDLVHARQHCKQFHCTCRSH